MKKPKFNLSGDTIKQFFLENGEKVGLGVAVGLMLLIVVAAFRRETLPADKAPERLVALAHEASKHIDDGNLPPPVTHPINLAAVQVPTKEVGEQFASAAKLTAAFLPPVREDLPKRGAPTILALRDLQGFAGRGAFALKGSGTPAPAPAPKEAAPPKAAANPLLGGTERTAPVPPPVAHQGNTIAQARHFIMLTGIVPTAEQQKEYDARFEEALKPDSEKVTAGGETTGVDHMRPQYYLYSVQRREVLPDGKFGPETPLDLRSIWLDKNSWGSSSQANQDPAPKEYHDSRLTFPLPPLLLRKWSDQVSHPAIANLKSDDAPAEAAPTQKTPDDFLNGPTTHKTLTPVANAVKTVPFKLFRFWDYTVEPQKSYQYRVQLIVYNPNYQLPGKLLEADALATEQHLLAPWSEWSEAISIPRDQQILAKSVEWDKATKEPIATVVCWTFDNKEGVEVHKEFKISRGEEALFTLKEPIEVQNPLGGTMNLENFTFDPKAVLLDFRGGEQTASAVGKTNPPCEMIFFDQVKKQSETRSETLDAPIIASLDEQTGAPAASPLGAPVAGNPLVPGAGAAGKGHMPKGPAGTLDVDKMLIGPPGANPTKATEKAGPRTKRPSSTN
ncbi:MAG TPA: hypothetical protein VFE24_10105 [Pirellulales bacterium]|jgi:hypothetical protein|nr:hypothetical protein [Pirellulales bacterium]